MTEEVLVKKGEQIIFTAGKWDDYRVLGLWQAAMDLGKEELSTYQPEPDAEEEDFVTWCREQGFITGIDRYHTFHVLEPNPTPMELVSECKYCHAIAAHSTARECEAWHEEQQDAYYKRTLWWYVDWYKIRNWLAWRVQRIANTVRGN